MGINGNKWHKKGEYGRAWGYKCVIIVLSRNDGKAPMKCLPFFIMFGGDGKLSKRDEFGLKPRQRAFADEYIINKGNAYQAAIKAGYSEKYAKNADQFLLENSGISKYLKMRTAPILEKRWEKGDEVLEEIAKLAFKEKRESIFKKIDNQTGEVIEDVTIERTPKDEDSLKALELLGKYHKLFTDKQEVEVQGTVVFANEDDIAD